MKRHLLLIFLSSLLVFSLGSAFASNSKAPTAKAKSAHMKACRTHKDCQKMKMHKKHHKSKKK